MKKEKIADQQFNLPLSNPLSILTGKEPKDFTREDLLKVILDKQIERITFHHTALDGKIKELKIPVSSIKQAELVLSEGERVDGSSLFRGIIDAGSSDLYIIPDYKTAFISPFDPTSLNFLCRYLTSTGELASFTPDNILARASDLIKKTSGLSLYALGELEFFLIGDFGNDDFPLPKQRGYHASSPFAKSGMILNEMLKYITQLCGNVKYAHQEVGCLDTVYSDLQELDGKRAEQVEIEFLPTPIEDTGDILVLSKWIIRNVAYKHGFVATFAPKLEIGHAGSGMHVHLALMKNNKNVMTTEKGELSENARRLIGGLCRYAPSLTAFGNMVSSSYLRLVPHQEAPTKVCWSEMNRSTLIRVPLGWTNAKNLSNIVNPQQKTKLTDIPVRQTVEIRSPDGSAQTHLLLAGISMAAEWGLRNKKESLEIAKNTYVQENIHNSDKYKDLIELATSCADSADILINNRDLYIREGIFPPLVIEEVKKILQNETDRNLEKRLKALPEEDKIKESRRIMHSKIHTH